MVEDISGDKGSKSQKRSDRPSPQWVKVEPLLIYAILFSLIALILTLSELFTQ